MPPSPTPRPSNRFRSRASLASVAALAATAAPSLLQAQIVWSGTLNTTVNSGSTTALLDFNQNSIADNTEAYMVFNTGKEGGGALAVASIANSKTDPGITFGYAQAPVSFGTTIGSGLSYNFETSPDELVPADGTSYYYRFAYQAGGGPYYGWMELSFSSDQSTGTLLQWAYNSESGAALTAGQTSAIPEPATTAALLGLAACGAVWWRKRRSVAQPA